MSDQTATVPVSPYGAPTPTPNEGSKRKWVILLIIIAVLIALIGGAFAWYVITRKPLSQIPVLSQETPPHYSATFYEASAPLGVALDEANNRMYVTQSTGDRNVLVFSTEGAKLGTLTAPGGKAGNHLPVYVAVNPKTSEVYVSDRATGAIYVYDVSGKYLREFKPKGLRSWAPLALAFDKDGNLFVTDVSGPAQKVLEVAADGTIVKTMGLKDGLSFPNGVAVLDDGKVAVSDSNNSRVLVYAPDGKTLGGLARGTSDSSLGLPRGLAVDDRGRLYVVDTVNHDVQAFVAADTPGGVPTYGFTFGEEGSIEGTFSYPNGVAVDTHGRIFVTDRANDRVQVWSY